LPRPSNRSPRACTPARSKSLRLPPASLRGTSAPPTAPRSTCAASVRRSSSSARRATISPHRSRRSTGSSTLYDSVDDIRAWGQTIVYTVHEQVGHLGIFVSAGVARKEHDEFASNIDLIDVLPPGLYEAVLTPKGEAADNPDLVTGEWLMRCEARTLDDIRALGGNDLADERKFESRRSCL
jgi:hypothetical protein